MLGYSLDTVAEVDILELLRRLGLRVERLLQVLKQNISRAGRKVAQGSHCFKDMAAGEIRVYRPVGSELVSLDSGLGLMVVFWLSIVEEIMATRRERY